MNSFIYCCSKTAFLVLAIPGLLLAVIGTFTLTLPLMLVGAVLMACAAPFAGHCEEHEKARSAEKARNQHDADIAEFGPTYAHILRWSGQAEKYRRVLREGTCPYCEGRGYNDVEYGDWEIQESCIHCSGTGRADRKGPGWEARRIAAAKAPRNETIFIH